MSSFSTIACYAALSSCSREDILHAYARMIAALIQRNRYKTCDIDTLCKDFKAYYGFSVPYHPMQTILSTCINFGFLTYNSSIHQFVPDYAHIDEEDFMDIVEKTDQKYREILARFKIFLQQEYNIYSSDEDMGDKILAFIERYGIKTKVDRRVLREVKDDYLFAAFLVHCEETGQTDILDYLNDYTIGLALSEVFAYCESPQSYTAKDACVYLDTGLLFKLFGIDSSDRADSYELFVRNIQKLGMHVKVYDHTVSEMIGIIEGSKSWINNPNYDATLSSEATYFFVRNQWSIDEIDEFSCNVRTRLKEDFNIVIDNMPYPKVEDIQTPTEAIIKEMIVSEYKESNPDVQIDDKKDYSINQDAKSIFFTQHKNNTVVPYHLNEVKNIFITGNRSLARVGYKISLEFAGSKDFFIPTVMTDIKWGTLVWFNSPSTLSSINRPRLVSAAYAAFRPSNDVTKKLNDALIKLEKKGDITPEQCYFLKVSPVAQRILGKLTANASDKIIDSTPLEILKEIRQSAYTEGSISRQEEIDNLTRKNETAEFELAKAKQQRIIFECQRNVEVLEKDRTDVKKEIEDVSEFLSEQDQVKDAIDKSVNKQILGLKIIITIASLIAIGLAVYIGTNYSEVLGIITAVISIFIIILTIWNKDEIKILSLISKARKALFNRQANLRRYSAEKVEYAVRQKESAEEKLALIEEKLRAARRELHQESAKLDRFSADISILQS